ncbi:MAG: hypothetical protein QM495_07010 [Lutibacter sp.]|uniref:hypothetical protein n=1 Tax=Lutibacter sp. TaxID=1925666 RepID=UPI00385AD40D
MNSQNIIIRNSLKIYLSIVLFFFLMKLFKLEQLTELRLLNFVFVFWGINSAVKKNIYINNNINYLQNLFIGFATSLLAVILLIFSLTIYLFYINPSFIHVIENLKIWGNHLTPIEIAFAIFTEGISSSIVISFILMQFWKGYKIPNRSSI